MSEVRDPARARRLARVLVSDLVAYSGDQVRIGLEKDDLFERLKAPIERARAFYTHQVHASLEESERIFNHALVDVLVASHRKVPTHIW